MSLIALMLIGVDSSWLLMGIVLWANQGTYRQPVGKRQFDKFAYFLTRVQ